jgi:hypothetical protein
LFRVVFSDHAGVKKTPHLEGGAFSDGRNVVAVVQEPN